MNIKNAIFKILKKDDAINAIINLNEVIKLPNRCDLSNDLLFQIDKYKSEYAILLNKKTYLLPNALSSKKVQDEIKMNIDLIVQQYLNIEELPHEKLEFIIKYLKLKVYLEKIYELYSEVLTRIIALKEISEEKLIISKHKRHRINYEINNLISIMIMLNSQRNALEKESDIYREDLLSLNINLNLTEEETIIVNKKLKDVSKLAKRVNINTDKNKGLSGLVALERMLEIYVYQNKEKINELKKKLQTLELHTLDVVKSDWLGNSSIRDYFYEDLKDLETKYRIFNEYGRNLITNDDLLELYRLKFKVLTRKFYENDYDIKLINEKTTSLELDCYKTIVSEMIEDIVKGKNFFYSMSYTDHGNNSFYKSKAINYMSKVLKDGEREFNYDKILNDQFLLNVLLAFTNQKILNVFYKNFKIDYCASFDINRQNHEITDLHKNMFAWDRFLPLDTIFKIDNINEKISSNVSSVNYIMSKENNRTYDRITYLKRLYLLTHDTKNDFIDNSQLLTDKKFYFPEGLKGIFLTTYETNKNVFFLNEIFKNIDHSCVCFPKSLIKLHNGDLFENVLVNGIYLNEGLEELNLGIFHNQNIKTITIPSTVKEIRRIGPDFSLPGNIATLEFQHFKESQLLNNKAALEILLNYCMTFTKLGSAFFYITKIYLIDENNKSYGMDLKSIENKSNRIDYCTPQETLNMVIEIFKEEVYKQTGFMLGTDYVDTLKENEEKLLTRIERKLL